MRPGAAGSIARTNRERKFQDAKLESQDQSVSSKGKMKTRTAKLAVKLSLGALALGVYMATQAADVSEYSVLKGKKYSQSDVGTPGDDFAFYWWSASVRMTADGSVTAATATPPGLEAIPLFEQADPKWLQFETIGGLTLPDMNANFPNGNYAVVMTTMHDGNRNVSLNLTGDSYPNTPTFLNFATLEMVNSSAAFTLSWSAFTDGTTNDYIQVRVQDGDDNEVFGSPAFGAVGALSGTATSVVVPPSTLLPENSYNVFLTFIKVITRDTTSYAGAIGLAGYYKSTEASLTTTAAGGTDTTPPQLVSSYPTNNASGVAASSPVIFTFNEAMSGAQSIAWSANVNAAGFLYNWSGNGRTLTCVYLGSLPTAATITWTLNPSVQPQDFADVAGNPLPANTYSGSFSTGISTNDPCDLGGDDGRGGGGVSKQLTYVQTSAASPTPDPENPATFLGSATSPTNNLITSANLQVSGGPLLTLTNFLGFGRSLVTTEEYASQSALDTARPNASYNLQLTRTTGGPVAADISLAGSWPPTPQILNYAAAQAVDPSADFVVQWNGFADATTNDSVGFSLVHPSTFWVWTAPDPCVPRALANTATSVTIPADTLQAGTTYAASLSYSRLTYSSSNAIPDMGLLAMLQKQLNFTLKTTGSSGSGPRFISWLLRANGNLEFKLQGTPGKFYRIEVSENLVGWTTALTLPAPLEGVITHEISPGAYGSPAFFRAREL